MCDAASGRSHSARGDLREHGPEHPGDLRPAIPATGIKYQLFAKGSDSPHHLRWSRDGKELFHGANPKLTGFEGLSVTTQPRFPPRTDGVRPQPNDQIEVVLNPTA